LTIPHPYEDGMAEYWINNHIVVYNEGKRVIYAITLKETDELVGAISLTNIVENHQAELGIGLVFLTGKRGIVQKLERLCSVMGLWIEV
jgi:RimJ/RimL family protein N-acetyltransferase